MVDSDSHSAGSMNPWVLHLQKLGLELKCPLCLNFLKRPLLLPCDHIFCNSCLLKTMAFRSECPVCKGQHRDQDLRSMPLIENMVTIYRSLDAAFSANILQSSDTGIVLKQCSAPTSIDCKDKQLFEASLEDASGRGLSKLLPKSYQLSCDPEDHFARGRVGKNVVMQREVKGEEQAMISEKNACNSKQNVISQPLNSQIRARELQESRTSQIVTNQVDQLSLGSPPSFGDNKDSENESNDQGGDDSPQNHMAAKLVELNSDKRIRQERNESSASEPEECCEMESKRHKLNYILSDLLANNTDLVKPNVPQTENLVAGFQLQTCVTLSDSSVEKSCCGFCHSLRITEKTGPMLHLLNGKLVEGVEASLSSCIHVHAICIEWAPQVYYAGETIKNLKAELARGAKLKCSKCGLKGAALGCYLKSCKRSYHAPCAMEITKCRWDSENFLMLCPAHSSVKFPNENVQSKKQNIKVSSLPTSMNPQQSSFWGKSSDGPKEWVFCGSALSSEEKFLLVKFGSMIGVPVTKFWRSNVTHVIAATDSNGACTRTVKVLMAILNGKWVLTIDWIKACMDSMQPVDEEPYEISLDNHGCSDGPKNGRLSALNNEPALFFGLNFYFVGDFVLGYKEDLQKLVVAGGGAILKSDEELVEQRDDLVTLSRTLVVYNLDPPQGCKLGEEVSIIWNRANEAEALAIRVGSQVIGHTWLLESISAYKLQPFVN